MPGLIKSYADLVKYRLSLAVTFSAITGYFVSDKPAGNAIIFLSAGVFLLSSAAAAINQYSERGYDSIMERTRNRPLPSDRINDKTALLVSIILLVSGSGLLLATGAVPALLGILTVVLYNAVYTRLKRVTFLAVIPGALVGAIPPVIGFTAAGGTFPGKEIVFLSLFIFFWQIPHFLLIIIRNRKDYINAGFKMLPEDFQMKQVRILVFAWVAVSTLFLAGFSATGLLFGKPLNIVLIAVNIVFIYLFHSFLFGADDQKSARNAFILINTFSLAIMIFFIINAFMG